MEKMTKVGVRLSSEMLRDLEAVAEANETTVSQVIRLAVRRYLEAL